MERKQNNFIRNTSILLLSYLFIVGCIQKPTRPTHTPPSTTGHKEPPTSPTTQVIVKEDPKIESSQPALPPPTKPYIETSTQMNEFPKFGFIFSGGGAKTWAHVGVLKELQKLKWPVHSVAGFEWGSVIAAEFAINLSANEVEWELSKFKNLNDYESFVKSAFAKKSTSNMKASFVCPSLNIPKQTSYLLNRGNLEQLVPYCLAAPGVMKPIYQSVAVLNDVPSLAQHLRSTGANKIILINVLSNNSKKNYTKDQNSTENLLWIESAALMNKKPVGVDEVVNLSLDDYGLNDFDKRREIMVKGSELSSNQLKKLANKFGL